MLVDIDSVEHAVSFAQKIARRMSKDPEVDSVAGEAAWRALYTYDLARNVKLSWWIAHLTKQAVICYWRQLSALRKKERLYDQQFWEEQSDHGRFPTTKMRYADDNVANRIPREDADAPISQDDWQLLVESFILQHPLDVIARDRRISITQARAMRRAAIARLEAATC